MQIIIVGLTLIGAAFSSGWAARGLTLRNNTSVQTTTHRVTPSLTRQNVISSYPIRDSFEENLSGVLSPIRDSGTFGQDQRILDISPVRLRPTEQSELLAAEPPQEATISQSSSSVSSSYLNTWESQRISINALPPLGEDPGQVPSD